MQAAKEVLHNAAAAARSGIEKSKATAQGQAEKAGARSDVGREAADEREHARNAQAEARKQEAQEHNAAARAINEAGLGSRIATRGGGEGGGGGIEWSGAEPGAGDAGVVRRAGIPEQHPAGAAMGRSFPTYKMPEHGSGYPTGGDMASGIVPQETAEEGLGAAIGRDDVEDARSRDNLRYVRALDD